MASADASDGEIVGATVIEVDDSLAADEKISPLLAEVGSNRRDRPNPKMTIFSVSYSRKRPLNKVKMINLFHFHSVLILFD